MLLGKVDLLEDCSWGTPTFCNDTSAKAPLILSTIGRVGDVQRNVLRNVVRRARERIVRSRCGGCVGI